MPRGVKGSGMQKSGKSLDTKIAENEALIESLQAKLVDAKAKRKELQQIKNRHDLNEIQKIIQKSGISAEDLKELIANKQR